MDCIKLMHKLPPSSIGLIVTSPPYNIRNSTGNGFNCRSKDLWSCAGLRDGYDGYSDNMPYHDYIAWQRECLNAMMRVLKEDGAIFYNHKWRVQNGLWQNRSEIVEGFPVRQVIIWHRKGGMNFNRGYFLPTYEVIYLIAKREFKLVSKANAHSDVWEIAPARGNDHPAPFPVELAQRCIESTNADIVLDPFMGSGTTALAAEKLGRQWIGSDISGKYCLGAKKRIKKMR